jgi:hypothetical protein
LSEHKNSSLQQNLPILTAIGVYYLFLRPQMRKWGTRLGESQRRLPGDELIPKPNFSMTHAVNIDAPPEAIWPWIAQMGRERTGYYGLDLLANQGIPSVTFIRQDIPAPEVGMSLDGGYRIIEIEPNRAFLFGGFSLQQPPGVTRDLTALYLLERHEDGSTRLLVRQRGFSYGMLGPCFNAVYEIVYFFGARQQISLLKRYAESMGYLKV